MAADQTVARKEQEGAALAHQHGKEREGQALMAMLFIVHTRATCI